MKLFTQLFGDLLAFVYHCFDRIVIYGYLSALSLADPGFDDSEPPLQGADALLERAEADLQIADLGGQGRDPRAQQLQTDLVVAHLGIPSYRKILIYPPRFFSKNSRPALTIGRPS